MSGPTSRLPAGGPQTSALVPLPSNYYDTPNTWTAPLPVNSRTFTIFWAFWGSREDQNRQRNVIETLRRRIYSAPFYRTAAVPRTLIVSSALLGGDPMPRVAKTLYMRIGIGSAVYLVTLNDGASLQLV